MGVPEEDLLALPALLLDHHCGPGAGTKVGIEHEAKLRRVLNGQVNDGSNNPQCLLIKAPAGLTGERVEALGQAPSCLR